MGDGMEHFSFVLHEQSKRGVTQTDSFFQYRIEYWSKIARRAIDHA